jgi:hypothetical protein
MFGGWSRLIAEYPGTVGVGLAGISLVSYKSRTSRPGNNISYGGPNAIHIPLQDSKTMSNTTSMPPAAHKVNFRVTDCVSSLVIDAGGALPVLTLLPYIKGPRDHSRAPRSFVVPGPTAMADQRNGIDAMPQVAGRASLAVSLHQRIDGHRKGPVPEASPRSRLGETPTPTPGPPPGPAPLSDRNCLRTLTSGSTR